MVVWFWLIYFFCFQFSQQIIILKREKQTFIKIFWYKKEEIRIKEGGRVLIKDIFVFDWYLIIIVITIIIIFVFLLLFCSLLSLSKCLYLLLQSFLVKSPYSNICRCEGLDTYTHICRHPCSNSCKIANSE